MNFPRLLIAGTHSGVGKTTVSLALMAALTDKGRRVQPFKVGPDFLDPTHHRLATGRDSYNLDGWMVDVAGNQAIFQKGALDADISIVEGMMGLFDGASPIEDSGSTAQMAKQLHLPVLLVVDGSALARSVAAMVHGYSTFDPSVRVVGVLFNRVNSEGHFRLLKDAVESCSAVSVVGYLAQDARLHIEDRHLGLQVAIKGQDAGLYEKLAKAATGTVDLEKVEELAIQASAQLNKKEEPSHINKPNSEMPRPVKIGIAYDSAFCFYYQENFKALRDQGAELVFFSPLKDPEIPAVDLLYLGGGYPELLSEELSNNVTMCQSVKAFAQQDGAIYAECGGLMYLMDSIENFEGTQFSMVGLFPFAAQMSRSHMMIGYRHIEVVESCMLGRIGLTAKGHEFHYSRLVPLDQKKQAHYACSISDASYSRKGTDGLMYKRSLALYSHIHFGSQPLLAKNLVEYASQATPSSYS